MVKLTVLTGYMAMWLSGQLHDAAESSFKN